MRIVYTPTSDHITVLPEIISIYEEQCWVIKPCCRTIADDIDEWEEHGVAIRFKKNGAPYLVYPVAYTRPYGRGDTTIDSVEVKRCPNCGARTRVVGLYQYWKDTHEARTSNYSAHRKSVRHLRSVLSGHVRVPRKHSFWSEKQDTQMFANSKENAASVPKRKKPKRPERR